MSRQQEFLEMMRESLGEPTSRVPVPQSAYARYENVLPPSLLDIWRLDGWSGYHGGLVWTTHPAEYDSIVASCIADTPLAGRDRFHVIQRDAFGGLVVWAEKHGRAFSVCSIDRRIMAYSQDFAAPNDDFDLTLLIRLSDFDRELADVEDDDGQWLFERARNSLGPLDPQTMYGFVPALALGGPARLENLRKVRIDVHLELLRGLGAPEVPCWGTKIPTG
jgi:hypothetical protein